ncbi:ATP-dependent RNA helicase DHX29 [Latimeria chalumnae]|uniref:ATP-dependent RNA helicase DHX29 n=1 Tax=Latimeria chalumnae TaxID=7897 RepID=H3ASU0_LATCH|nr:PREDICTED: ATP-dependent RNA helicase DHX29 [Latimeria chalumnae]|eukprot:XP_005998507.1 PREDICTED: ATP-dependent RNA helicase DHX29 [Latimeria chalumnae]
MGGKKKNKTEPVPAAAASGSKTGGPSGAVAESKKSKARAACGGPAKPPSAKEKQAKGPKTYSFAAAAAANESSNDKSVLKVVIESSLEQRIIGLINQFKKEHGNQGTISGRLTSKKLQDLYMALQGFSFKTEHIEEAMKNTVLYGGDLYAALDWLCLNLPNDALPEGFSQKLQEEEKKNKPKFQPVQEQAIQQQAPESKHDNRPKPKESVEKAEQETVKDWILRYTEQESSEDDDVVEEPKKKSEEDEHFDPNERYLELTAKLLDAKEQAASAKQNKDKQVQREAQEQLKKIHLEMKSLEDHPMFNKAIKIPGLKQEEKKSFETPEEDSELNFSLFEDSAAVPEEKAPVNKEPKDIRNFDYTSRSWTGKSPKQFLIDWSRKNFPKSPNPSFVKVPVGRYWKCRVKVDQQKDGRFEVCPTILTEDSMQAQHLAATLALYRLIKGQSIHQLLPPPYRDVWLEWSEEAKKKEEQSKLEINKPRDQFISKLLTKLKQQQQQQQQDQQQQQSQNAVSTSEELEETWEDLITEEDFDKISIDQGKPDNLESVKALFRKLQNSAKYQKLLWDRQLLPVFQHRSRIMDAVRKHRVVVVAGETGSGKSTQIPHFLLEDLLACESGSQKCNIVCTQPRRISAMSLATRVCEELGCEEGPGATKSLCGYQIRMETKVGDFTRLLYCTTGVLLRKLQQDGLLENTSHVIVDEVHERSVQSDFLLVILKEILRKRSDLHLILMSATVDSDKFASYFGHCPVIKIPGRTYPVQVCHLEDVIEETGYILEKDSEYCQKFLEEEEEITLNITGKGGKTQTYQECFILEGRPGPDLEPSSQEYSAHTRQAVQYMNPNKINLELILELLDFLDKSPQYRAIDGAVLIFLPGLASIQHLYDLLSTDRRFKSKERYKLIALHSILSSQDQAAAFTIPPAGVRKIVLATNIAETGITIPDVVFVIDSGKTKESRYHESSQMSSLVETFISKASALQRQGRAGRIQEGFCFRLFTQERYKNLPDYSVPEILRVPLEELCLHIMKCNHGSPEDFLSRALDPPQLQAVGNAMSLLRKIGACELSEPKLTPLGQHLAALPVNVKIGKMLIFGAIFDCLDPVATIAAAITEKSPFVTPMNRKEEADLSKAALAFANSDHLTLYSAYLGWKKARQESYSVEMSYCRKHFLNRQALLTIEDVKQELVKLIEAVGFAPLRAKSKPHKGSSATETRWPSSPQAVLLLKAVLTAGLYDSLGKILYVSSVDITEKIACMVETAQGKAQVHPSSVNRDLQTHGWLLYQEKVKYGKIYLRDTSLISPFPVLLFGGDIEVQHRECLLSVDGWIQFQAPVRIGVIFKQLRVLIDSVLQRKLENPKTALEDDKTIQLIMELIKSE